MNTNLVELFDFFEYIDDESIKKVMTKVKEMHEDGFTGFFGTSYGSNMKDMMSFLVAYEFLKNGKSLDKLIFAITSYQDNFFNNSLIHLENLSCIFGENLLPSFSEYVPHFINKKLLKSKEFKDYEKKFWLEDFLSDYNPEKRIFNYDNDSNSYFNKFKAIEKRILFLKLDEKLNEKETIKQRKI